MSVVYKARLVRVGNSRGIRIPRAIVDQLGLDDQVEMEVQDKQLVVRSARKSRQSWDEQFKRMAEHGDDYLIDQDLSNIWDETEWEW